MEPSLSQVGAPQTLTPPVSGPAEFTTEEWPLARRFEQEWREGRNPQLEQFRPAGKEWTASLLGQLIPIDIRYRIKAGEAARVEVYRDAFKDLLEPALLQCLLVVEWQTRLASGESVSSSELSQRFPRMQDMIRSNPLLREEGFTGFEFLGVLGHGGMGMVFKVRDRAKREVALKTILPRYGLTDQLRARFKREWEAQALAEHENIVRIYQVDEEAGVPFYTMEYVEGPSLAQLLQREMVSIREILILMEAIASVVPFLPQSRGQL